MVRFKNRYVLGKIEWFDTDDIMDLGDSKEKKGVEGVGSSDIYKSLRSVVIETFGQFGFATIQSSIQGYY